MLLTINEITIEPISLNINMTKNNDNVILLEFCSKENIDFSYLLNKKINVILNNVVL